MAGVSRLVPVGGLVLLAAVSGCGPGKAHVTGRATLNGQPYTSTEERARIVFHCDSPSIDSVANVQPDGTFVAYGPNADGLPPGKYRIGIDSSEDGPRKKIRELSGEKSPMELDLTRGGQVNIVVDLAKHQMTQ